MLPRIGFWHVGSEKGFISQLLDAASTKSTINTGLGALKETRLVSPTAHHLFNYTCCI